MLGFLRHPLDASRKCLFGSQSEILGGSSLPGIGKHDLHPLDCCFFQEHTVAMSLEADAPTTELQSGPPDVESKPHALLRCSWHV